MENITIFTPTYNREYCLENLYQSLVGQTSHSFVWLIVDDGSTDHTRTLVASWIMENKIPIRYIFQENAGKAQAHNRGVEETKTELFTCVDSDDMLKSTAVEHLIEVWKEQKERTADVDLIGMLAKKVVPNGTPMTILNMEKLDVNHRCTLKHAYDIGAVYGDTFLIYKTDYIKRVSFPKFEGEKFVPENYIYDQLDQMGELYFLDENLYYAEYLADGISKNFDRTIAGNPYGYLAYVEQRLTLDDSLKSRCGDLIRYTSAALLTDKKNIYRKHRFLSTLMYPFGCLLYLKRFKRYEINKKVADDVRGYKDKNSSQ